MGEKKTELGEMMDKTTHTNKKQAFEMQGPHIYNLIGQNIVGRGDKKEGSGPHNIYWMFILYSGEIRRCSHNSKGARKCIIKYYIPSISNQRVLTRQSVNRS